MRLIFSLLLILFLTPAAYAGTVDDLWKDTDRDVNKFCPAYGSAMARSIIRLKESRHTQDEAYQKVKNESHYPVFHALIEKSVLVVYGFLPDGKTPSEKEIAPKLTWVCAEHMANHIRPFD